MDKGGVAATGDTSYGHAYPTHESKLIKNNNIKCDNLIKEETGGTTIQSRESLETDLERYGKYYTACPLYKHSSHSMCTIKNI